MLLKYDCDIQINTIQQNLNRLTNQVYKLLPLREEGGDWTKPLYTILEEFAGMDRLFIDQQSSLYKLLCKLEGLFTLTDEKDFMIYRSIVFECLSIIGEMRKWLDSII